MGAVSHFASSLKSSIFEHASANRLAPFCMSTYSALASGSCTKMPSCPEMSCEAASDSAPTELSMMPMLELPAPKVSIMDEISVLVRLPRSCSGFLNRLDVAAP